MSDAFPAVLTLQDAANLLVTTPDVLQDELEAGRLQGFRVGSEWRTTKQALLNFIGEKPSQTQDLPITKPNPNPQGAIDMSNLNWKRIPSFTYHWPKNADQTTPNTETFDPVFEAEFRSGTRTFPAKIAFTIRPAAGQNRSRGVVFIKNIPAVEFVGADDFEQSGRLASVIKGKDGKHIRTEEDLPVEYIAMPVDLYTNLVTGPYAARSMAVIADKDDLTLMARHAIIRALWKNWIA